MWLDATFLFLKLHYTQSECSMSTLRWSKQHTGYNMRTLQQIREALKDRRLSVVSEATGLHYNTLRQLRDDEDHSPSYDTVRKLNEYLEARENAAL